MKTENAVMELVGFLLIVGGSIGPGGSNDNGEQTQVVFTANRNTGASCQF